MSQSTPTKHDGRAVLFAVAELLVMLAMIEAILDERTVATYAAWQTGRRHVDCSKIQSRGPAHALAAVKERSPTVTRHDGRTWRRGRQSTHSQTNACPGWLTGELAHIVPYDTMKQLIVLFSLLQLSFNNSKTARATSQPTSVSPITAFWFSHYLLYIASGCPVAPIVGCPRGCPTGLPDEEGVYKRCADSIMSIHFWTAIPLAASRIGSVSRVLYS